MIDNNNRIPTETDRKLKVFFSVDIQGSTEHKTKNNSIRNYESHWARSFEYFFEQFPKQFAGACKKTSAKLGNLELVEPEIWKFLGDEILFASTISNKAQLYLLTREFVQTTFENDKEFQRKHQLRIKGTAWTAGFPISNSEIRIANSVEGKQGLQGHLLDFIGPDIDIGFRLSKVAKPGRVVLSMPLTELLVNFESGMQNFYEINDISPLEISHVGWKELKGVFNGIPYPVFWAKCAKHKIPVSPWEEHTCEFTKTYLHSRLDNSEKIPSLIKQIRKDLQDPNMYPHYIDESEMPEHHQKQWEDWKRSKQQSSKELVTDYGISEDI